MKGQHSNENYKKTYGGGARGDSAALRHRLRRHGTKLVRQRRFLLSSARRKHRTDAAGRKLRRKLSLGFSCDLDFGCNFGFIFSHNFGFDFSHNVGFDFCHNHGSDLDCGFNNHRKANAE